LERSGSVMWKADTSKVVPPPVSVKDRWVSPCEQVLNIPITCWYIGPVSLVVSRQQKVDFAPTASMVGLREKLGTDPLC
jgi:hypothetical protein